MRIFDRLDGYLGLVTALTVSLGAFALADALDAPRGVAFLAGAIVGIPLAHWGARRDHRAGCMRRR